MSRLIAISEADLSGVFRNETDQLWTGAVWETATLGPTHVNLFTRIETSPEQSLNVPTEAAFASANWRALIYASTDPTVTDPIFATAEKPAATVSEHKSSVNVGELILPRTGIFNGVMGIPFTIRDGSGVAVDADADPVGTWTLMRGDPIGQYFTVTSVSGDGNYEASIQALPLAGNDNFDSEYRLDLSWLRNGAPESLSQIIRVGTPLSDVRQADAEAAIDAKEEDKTLPSTDENGQVTATNGGGGGNNTISPEVVSDKRTFFVGREGSTSRSIVTLKSSSQTNKTVTLQVVPELNDTDINSTGTHVVSVVGLTTLTVTNVTTRKDGQAIHFDIPADSAADTYTMTAEVATLDGNTVVMTGKLVIN